MNEQITNWLLNNRESLQNQFKSLLEIKNGLLQETNQPFHSIIESDFYNAVRETIIFQVIKDLNITPEEAIIHIETLTDSNLNDFLGEKS
jgi:hypothetical protein